MFQIAVFGKVSSGKSALLNAVFETNAFAVDPRAGSTRAVQSAVAPFGDRDVCVVDTPGIMEIDGEDRGDTARDAATDADLVVVVCDKDVTDSEFRAIAELAAFGKPLLVVLNKVDALSVDAREALLGQMRVRLSGLVDPSHVLACAARPLRFYARERADGTVEEWDAPAPADIVAVRRAIDGALRHEAPDLVTLNELAHRIDANRATIEEQRQVAASLIEEHALDIAVRVARNPVPLFDLYQGREAFHELVKELAACYQTSLPEGEAFGNMVWEAAWSRVRGAVITMLGGSLLRVIPLAGWLVAALPQAVAAYYVARVMGEACSGYLAERREGLPALHATLDEVIRRTDRKRLAHHAAQRIKDRLNQTAHTS